MIERETREITHLTADLKKKKIDNQDLALITVDERSPGIFDVYRLNLATGEKKFTVIESFFFWGGGEERCFVLQRERERERANLGLQNTHSFQKTEKIKT